MKRQISGAALCHPLCLPPPQLLCACLYKFLLSWVCRLQAHGKNAWPCGDDERTAAWLQCLLNRFGDVFCYLSSRREGNHCEQLGHIQLKTAMCLAWQCSAKVSHQGARGKELSAENTLNTNRRQE